MNKILELVNKYGMLTILLMVMIIYLRTCTTNNKIDKVKNEIIEMKKTNDSTNSVLNYKINATLKEIKREGLRSEKRMIQSTDRKMLDVNRQTEIDKELEKLDKND